MGDPFIELADLLDKGKRCVLARIIGQVGSAPRSIGTKCIVLEDGSLIGTIGGGRLEHQVRQRARGAMGEGRSKLLHFRLAGEDVAHTEMLCGGIVDVYLEAIFPENEVARRIFRSAGEHVREGVRAVLITRVSEGIGHGDEACRALIGEDGSSTGTIGTFSEEEGRRLTAFLDLKRPRLIEHQGQMPRIFAEPIEPEHVLYLFGAGHISSFVAPLAKMVGFRVVVIDDREEFVNEARFPTADELLVRSFSGAPKEIPLNRSSYVAILTRGHVHDRTVLREVLKGSPAYIGMIGSRRKRDLVYQSLLDEGYSEERLAEVHSPIGLDIHAETPEEIAISIVAELIAVRAGNGVKGRLAAGCLPDEGGGGWDQTP